MRESVLQRCYDIFEADFAFGEEIDCRTAVGGGVPHTSHMHISIDRIEICINRLNPESGSNSESVSAVPSRTG